MKNLILVLALVIPFTLLAQDKLNTISAGKSDLTHEWMTNIASDPSTREKMIEMIIDKTKNSPEEMTMLINLILKDSVLQSMIEKVSTNNKNYPNMPLDKIEMVEKSKKAMESTEPREKPVLGK